APPSSVLHSFPTRRSSDLQYRTSVRNRLHDALFVRLSDFELVDDHGLEVGTDATSAECTIGAGVTEGVLAGEVWVPKKDVERVRSEEHTSELQSRFDLVCR